MALNIDIAPTILDIAGVPIPSEMDGLSLYPLIKGENCKLRDEFFLEHVGVIDAFRPIPDSVGVRTENWKYIKYVNVEPEIEELYDLNADPMESRNLINNSKHSKVLDRLRKRCRYPQEN